MSYVLLISSYYQTECMQPVREAVSYRGLFTAGWFGVREKHCFRLEIYDRLRASEQAECHWRQKSFKSIISFYFERKKSSVSAISKRVTELAQRFFPVSDAYGTYVLAILTV